MRKQLSMAFGFSVTALAVTASLFVEPVFSRGMVAILEAILEAISRAIPVCGAARRAPAVPLPA
jgi:hypothetical protein